MNRIIIIAALSLLALLAAAGCTGILPVQNDPGSQPAPTQQEMPYQPTGEAPAADPQAYSQPYSQPAGGMSSLSRMVIWAEPLDLGGFHNQDGLVIKYRFYDAYNRPVSFEGTTISMQITMHTPDTNRQKIRITPRQIYRGSSTITRSLPEGDYPLRGIWIPYSEISLGDQDRGIGRIHARASLPTGVVLEADEWYIWPVT